MRLEGICIRVPASTSNLGSGFDTLGLALQLYLDVTVRQVTSDGAVTCSFAGAPVHGDNRIATAYRLAAEREGVRVPGLTVDVASDIPIRAGLGSSAAAIVAGLRLFEAVAGARTDEWRLRLATELEGHPDNATPAILGGLTVSAQCEDGRVAAVAARWPEEIGVVVATPRVQLETSVARRALPPAIARADAVFNLQRTALLLQSLHARRLEHIGEALRDRWHQPYRLSLVPVLADALALTHPSLLGVFLSGAGPSVVALTSGASATIEALLASAYRGHDVDCDVRTVPVHQPPEAGAAC